MSKTYSWYKADQRRKKICEEKKMRAARYVEEMNKRANDQQTQSNP